MQKTINTSSKNSQYRLTLDNGMLAIKHGLGPWTRQAIPPLHETNLRLENFVRTLVNNNWGPREPVTVPATAGFSTYTWRPDGSVYYENQRGTSITVRSPERRHEFVRAILKKLCYGA